MPKTQKTTKGVATTELHPDFLQAIGHVAVQWSIFEMFLGLTMRGFLHVTQRQSYAVTSQHNIGVLLHMSRALAKETLPNSAAKKRFDTIAKRALSLMKDRNNVIHAFWAVGKDGVAVRAKFTGYGEVKFQSARMTARDVETIADKISSLSGDLYGFLLDNSLIWND